MVLPSLFMALDLSLINYSIWSFLFLFIFRLLKVKKIVFLCNGSHSDCVCALCATEDMKIDTLKRFSSGFSVFTAK